MSNSSNKLPSLLLGSGLVAGAALAAVDNILFRGEVSPIVIVGLLLAMTITAGALWGSRAWLAVVTCWLWLPAAHVVKHVAGLPDTIQPNTYTSILLLAAFTFAVAAIGWALGLLIHRAQSTPA
ncbi:MAG TPA: hypothetical protein VMH83_01850 [Candidatus Acidoferrum sp.]|nr:hypothetical protein [Candidatus Acidoferrum sp.]